MVLFFFEHKTKMFYCLHPRLALTKTTPALSHTTLPPSPHVLLKNPTNTMVCQKWKELEGKREKNPLPA
jgi:hypothetical protein